MPFSEWKMLQLLDALPPLTVFINVEDFRQTRHKYLVCRDYNGKWKIVGANRIELTSNYVIVQEYFTTLQDLIKQTGIGIVT